MYCLSVNTYNHIIDVDFAVLNLICNDCQISVIGDKTKLF